VRSGTELQFYAAHSCPARKVDAPTSVEAKNLVAGARRLRDMIQT